MTPCAECNQVGGCMTGAGICNSCLYRIHDELAFLEHMAKEVCAHEPNATLFGPGGFGHRMILLQARVYSWTPDGKRDAWLKERGLGTKQTGGDE